MCVCVCWVFFVSQHYSKCYEHIAIKFYGGVQGNKMKKCLDFRNDPGHHANCLIRNPSITEQIMNGLQ